MPVYKHPKRRVIANVQSHQIYLPKLWLVFLASVAFLTGNCCSFIFVVQTIDFIVKVVVRL